MQFSEYGIKGLHDDIEKSHLTAHYENELEKIHNVKQEIIQNILKLKTQQENITLKMAAIHWTYPPLPYFTSEMLQAFSILELVYHQ